MKQPARGRSRKRGQGRGMKPEARAPAAAPPLSPAAAPKQPRAHAAFAGIALLLIGVLAGMLLAFLLPQQRAAAPEAAPGQPTAVSLDALSTDGYLRVEPSVDADTVYFTAGCTRVGMATTEFQTYSIQNGMSRLIEVRPTVHDVLKDLVDSFGMEVLQVKLDSKDGTELGYHASIFLKSGNKVVSLEARPSDGTALAVRTGARLWFKQDTFEKLGQDICK